MPDNVSVNVAMEKYYRPLKNKGKDLDELGLSISQAKQVSQNRKDQRVSVNPLYPSLPHEDELSQIRQRQEALIKAQAKWLSQNQPLQNSKLRYKNGTQIHQKLVR